MVTPNLSVLEICAGGGGQALGLERAGFSHVGAVEIDATACATLRLNRPKWNVIGPPDSSGNVSNWDGSGYTGVSLLAGGVPCPPFSIAGRQLGQDDERDLFPSALRIISEAKPRSVMLENVPGLATSKFSEYRNHIHARLADMGYLWVDWRVVNACDFGVPQLRPRFILVAFSRKDDWLRFAWPAASSAPATVGETLFDLVAARGWPGAFAWREKARSIAPTIVGGSKKHGGADLGPTRAKAAWRTLGVDGMGISDLAPGSEFPLDQNPRLTLAMVARLQGFSDDWKFAGRKTAIYRQIGNAFPPPVAAAVGSAIFSALAGSSKIVDAARLAG